MNSQPVPTQAPKEKPAANQEPLVKVDFDCHRVVVVVPSFNEERFIGSVLLKLKRYPITLIVVDDGSDDDTAEIAVRAGAQVIQMGDNQGKGAALNAGFMAARDLQPDAIVVIDADGQHLVEELPRVVQPILGDEADIVVGSRYIRGGSGVPAHRVLGHLFFRLLTNLSSGTVLSDTQSGFRAFSPRAYQTVNFQSRGYAVESEMQFWAHEEGLRVAEVPITVRYDTPARHSVWQQGLVVLNGVLRLTGQYRPLLSFGLPGALVLGAGFIMGGVVVDIYSRTKLLAVGYALISVLLSVMGMTLLSTGVTLHSVRGLLIELFRSKGR